MSAAAVGVLVAGLLLVAAIVGAALVVQWRRDRRPARGPALPPAAPPARPRTEPAPDPVRPDPVRTDPVDSETLTTRPITNRTAQADPVTVQHPAPRFGEGERHPTPPPSNGNGRAL